jgi:hypothetical protein
LGVPEGAGYSVFSSFIFIFSEEGVFVDFHGCCCLTIICIHICLFIV